VVDPDEWLRRVCAAIATQPGSVRERLKLAVTMAAATDRMDDRGRFTEDDELRRAAALGDALLDATLAELADEPEDVQLRRAAERLELPCPEPAR
jgi:hypothetical protein